MKHLPLPLVRPLLAIAAISTAYALAVRPEPPAAELEGLAKRFSFEQAVLGNELGLPERRERTVHPLLRPISAWISSVGAAAALGDLDGDGLDNDCVLVDPRTDEVRVTALMDRRYATFDLTPGPLPFDRATMAPMGALIGDFNEDGRPDVLVYYWGRSPIVFLRKDSSGGRDFGPASFAAHELLPTVEPWYTNAATQADLDGDGHVDLVFGNYFPDGSRILDATATNAVSMQESMSRAHNGGPSRVLLWKEVSSGGSVTYEDASAAIPMELRCGWTLAVGCADLDGDQLPELYLANDFGEDHLFHNRSTPGHLSFQSVVGRRHLTTPASKVLGKDSFKGMGIDFGDVNGDGIPDLFVSNIARPYALEESHFLFQSTGRLEEFAAGYAPYEDVSDAIGLSRSSWGWDCKLDDFDNDGVLEAVQAVGFVRGAANRWSELQELAMCNDKLVNHTGAWMRVGPGDDLCGWDHDPFFVRLASGRFADAARAIGIERPQVSRGVAIADVDGDGLLDMVIANQWSDSTLYHNTAPRTNAFLALHVVRPVTGAPVVDHAIARPGRALSGEGVPAIGASVRIRRADGAVGLRQVDGGNGHSGKRSATVHIGLGRVEAGASIATDVSWRDGGGLHSTRLLLTPGEHTIILPNGQITEKP